MINHSQGATKIVLTDVSEGPGIQMCDFTGLQLDIQSSGNDFVNLGVREEGIMISSIELETKELIKALRAVEVMQARTI